MRLPVGVLLMPTVVAVLAAAVTPTRLGGRLRVGWACTPETAADSAAGWSG